MQRIRLWGLALLCGINLTQPTLAAEQPTIYMQVFLGELQLDDNTVTATRDDIEYEGELDDIPYLGGTAQVAMHDGMFSYGWEGGAFVSWINDEVSYIARSGTQGGQVRIAVDNAFWSIETSIGLWAAVRPIDRMRLYVSAGPLLIFGRADTDGPDDDQQPQPAPNTAVITNQENHDTDWSPGGYVRAGVEFRLSGNTWMGLNVRHMKTDLNLEDSIGRFDIDGNLYLLSVTNRF